MRLTEVECRDFRCIESLRFSPQPGLNIIRGGNAQGKTSLLEAILFAATSKSHRTNVDYDLVRHGQDAFSVRIHARSAEREARLEAHWWRGAKRFKVNGVAQTRISDILGRINVVFFAPEDVGLVKEGAGRRRQFLDMELSQIDGAYLTSLQQYRQTLRQRNELLRGAAPDEALLDVYDTQLSEHGAVLMAAREAFLAQLSDLAEAAHARIAGTEGGGDALEINYRPDVRGGENLAAVLEESRAGDLKRRLTQRGPHRDDADILIGGRAARVYASQGQQKTAALALKLAETELVKLRTGSWPVLMLDEVLAELDAQRARRLFTAVSEEVQLIVTTANTERDLETGGRPHAAFLMREGRLEAL